MDSTPLPRFPKWSNKAVIALLVAAATVPIYLGLLLAYGANPTTLNVGYAPVQPVPYSHALHVGKLGLDCRYCHTTVERAAMAALPPTGVCMNCHKAILPESTKLAEVQKSYVEGSPIPWIKVHDLADYVYFNHSAHVNVGVGCFECHGPIQQMETVRTVEPLNMAWCLKCHRDPAPYLRPRDQVTNMDWTLPGSPAVRRDFGNKLMQNYRVHPSTDCVTCHR
jgi:menaquinone reductase, multiheme cytochrome c subunit